MTTPFPDPREGRQRGLVRFLEVGIAVVLVSALASLAASGETAHDLGVAMVVALVVVPVSRVAWLLVRWWRKGDRRFALAAAALLIVVGSAALVGLLS